MAITTAGLNFISQAIIGQGMFFNTANARLGVGDGSTFFTASQTDLTGTNKLRKEMDAGYPKVDPPKVTFKSTFSPSEANFTWYEWGIFNAASNGVMLNRVVSNNGTKQDNQTWVLEVEVTFSTGR